VEFKKKPYKRHERLSKQIKIILSDFILKDFNLDGSGIITITKVKISNDLSNAKIFYSVINNTLSNQEVLVSLNKKARLIKGIIGKKITSKNIPNIIFYFDDSVEKYEKMDRIFIKLNDE
tara:strand:- start:52 stop:411 length:360 start_codon:yes stop_codon:yes gene_type:complete